MKIIASRIDDLRRQKQARKDLRNWKNRQEGQMRKDQFTDAYQPLKEYLEENLSKYDLLDIDVNISGYSESVDIHIRNEQNFKEGASLSWHYYVSLDNSWLSGDSKGEIKKETGSWSGLSAVTDQEMAHLEQCVSAIKWLNSVDWEKLLNESLSKASKYSYTDYTNKDLYEGDMDFDEKMDYDAEIIAEQLRELTGRTDVLVKSSEDYRPAYYMIHKETPKFFIVSELPRYVVEDEDNVRDSYQYKYAVEQLRTQRIRKDAVDTRFSDPIEVVEI